MQKTTNRFGILETIELIFVFVYLITGKLLYTFVTKEIVGLVLIVLTSVFIVLLLIFMKYHSYRREKPLLTAFSIYYKSLIYIVVIFTACNYPGKDFFTVMAMVSIVLYMVLSYINGKQYYQMLNAYLYLQIACFARLHLFFHVS